MRVVAQGLGQPMLGDGFVGPGPYDMGVDVGPGAIAVYTAEEEGALRPGTAGVLQPERHEPLSDGGRIGVVWGEHHHVHNALAAQAGNGRAPDVLDLMARQRHCKGVPHERKDLQCRGVTRRRAGSSDKSPAVSTTGRSGALAGSGRAGARPGR